MLVPTLRQADVSNVMLLSGFTNCQSSCSGGITLVRSCPPLKPCWRITYACMRLVILFCAT